MKRDLRSAIKIFIYCFIVVNIQTALITDSLPMKIDLVFSSMIVFASMLGVLENLAASVFFTVFYSMLFHNGDIYWFYPVIAVLASKFNPEQIADKFLICVLYTIFFTALHEIFNPSSLSYFDKIMEGTLVNLITMIPLFLLIKVLFGKERQSSWT